MGQQAFILCRDCGFRQRFIPIEAEKSIFSRVGYDAKCPNCNIIFEVLEKEIIFSDL